MDVMSLMLVVAGFLFLIFPFMVDKKTFKRNKMLYYGTIGIGLALAIFGIYMLVTGTTLQ